MGRSDWEDLVDSAREELKSEYEGPSYEYQDRIFQIADSTTPVYNADRLEVILSNMWLGSTESDLGSDGTVFGLAGVIIHEALEQELFEYLDTLEEEWKDTHGTCEACDEEFLVEDSNAEDDSNFCSLACEDEFNAEVEVA